MRGKAPGRRRTLRFEFLERRELLDGNVTAVIKHGDLIIRGDDLANEVAVFRVATNAPAGFAIGDYVVLGGTGGNGAAATSLTTINGKAFEVFSASRLRDDVVIKMGAGDDAVAVGDIQKLDTDHQTPATQNLVAALGGMTSETSMTLPDRLRVRGQSGEDAIGLQGVQGRSTRIETGLANTGDQEVVGVFNSTFKKLGIRTDAGNDDVSLDGNQVRNVNIKTRAGDDTVAMANNNISRQLNVKLGPGNDTFDAQTDGGNNTVGRRTRVNGGDGTNTFLTPTPDTNSFGKLRKRNF